MTTRNLRVSPRTVQQEIVEKLRGAIIEGIFKPGDRLVEADLCETLGVSRPSIREALRGLEAERLVEIIPNRGPMVPILTWAQATEIYQVRALLEGEAAFIAAKKATPADLKLMRASLADFGRAVRADDSKARVASTAEFYGHILRICGHRIIEEMLTGLIARINFLRARSMSQPGRAKVSLQEMKAIFDAIEAGNSTAARNAAMRHVENARRSAGEAYELLAKEESAT